MCGVMLAMIIFVLQLFKFPVNLNCFTSFYSYTNFIFATVSYGSSSSCYCSVAAAGLCRCSLASSSFLLLLILPLLLLFQRRLLVSPVHIPYSPSSCYTIKKQYDVCSAAFLQVHLVFLSQVPMQRYIILKMYFSKMNSSFILYLSERFFENFMHRRQIISRWSFYRSKKPMKTYLNSR